MSDVFSKEKRSSIMSQIHSKETKPEIIVRKFLFKHGYRYRKNDRRYSGKPDIVLPKYKTIIFVNGCFWHGHDCPAGKLPQTRHEFWKNKITKNKIRDFKNIKKLEADGWKVIVIWQCELKNKKLIKHTLEKLIKKLTG